MKQPKIKQDRKKWKLVYVREGSEPFTVEFDTEREVFIALKLIKDTLDASGTTDTLHAWIAPCKGKGSVYQVWPSKMMEKLFAAMR